MQTECSEDARSLIRHARWLRAIPAAKARRCRADIAAQRLLPAIQRVQSQGISSLHGIAAGLNALGVATVRGTKWTPTAVRRVLERTGQRPSAVRTE